MFYMLVILFICSAAVNIFLFRSRLNLRTEIKYIRNKLRKVVNEETGERLLLNTEDKYIKSLLIQINRLLDHNQKIKGNCNSIELSMRKMLSNISHDLKTPLTVILGYIEIINNDKSLTSEKVMSLLKTVNLKTVEVLALINRFFELVKLESGDKKLNSSRIDICEVSRKIILDYYEILISKEFEVVIDIPDDSVFVNGDEDAIERVLNNLITNAIQYGSDGKMVGLKIRITDNDVFVEISDKGKGINEMHKDRVFERMYTLEDSRNTNYQGSGLGLTITKRLVEQMGGGISLNSVPFKETTFSVRLRRIKF
ncbi:MULTISPECIES: sensor histidine kinase [Bacillus amyloliquefaciens group]|uniref:sensor histidine kinase n=1 Tax=Bacillus amyloliquefaciens group TaxID=1938374 RepID=UPI00069C6A38|nr:MULTISPECIES: sensor histidine kinase [Bacillus amyloliquefaciens group]KNX32882.1 histidine kinase [Bacillus amyloliquefaciens]MCM3105339.1 sensor histidine kinase [Bacillus velezensis]MCR4383745.1 sensor histidine kinase [Bacillus amyloliquefaciens]MDQ9148440.1 sensor histidine kinase [Bacillus velezensis]MEC2186082.1 sensor histidine kinase [Bacillus velezensis]